nr:RDD family protein [Auraticoccus cholistanensis]
MSAVVDLTWMGALVHLWTRATEGLATSGSGSNALALAGSLVITFAAPIAVETLSRGRTPGRWAMGLRVVRDDGGAIRLRHALTRWLAFWLVDFSVLTLGVLGLVVAGVHPQGRRIGDLLAGTVVVRVRAPRRPPPLPDPDPELADWMARLQLSGVPDDLLAAARTVVRRRRSLRAVPRQQLMEDLASRVWQRITPPPPRQLTSEELLVAVVAERRRRARDRSARASSVPTAEQLPAGWR